MPVLMGGHRTDLVLPYASSCGGHIGYKNPQPPCLKAAQIEGFSVHVSPRLGNAMEARCTLLYLPATARVALKQLLSNSALNVAWGTVESDYHVLDGLESTHQDVALRESTATDCE